MCYAATSGNGDLYIRQAQPEISMNKFAEASLFIDPVELIQACPVAIGHHAIVRTYHACKKAEADDAFSIVVLQAFIIDQRNLPAQQFMEELSVLRVVFSWCEKRRGIFYCLPGRDGDLFNAQHDITVTDIFF